MMIEQLAYYILSILHGIVFGITGFLIASVLTRRGEFLHWWPPVVRFIIRTKSEDPDHYNGIQYFFYKTAYGCSKCVAGQLAFWVLILQHDFGHVAASVVVAVFTAFVIEKLYES